MGNTPQSRYKACYNLLFDQDECLVSNIQSVYNQLPSSLRVTLDDTAEPYQLKHFIGLALSKHIKEITDNFYLELHSYELSTPEFDSLFLSCQQVGQQRVITLTIYQNLGKRNGEHLNRYKRAVDCTQLGVWDVVLADTAENYWQAFINSPETFFSPKMRTILRLPTTAQLTWQIIRSQMHPDDVPIFDSLLANHLEFEMPLQIECRIHNQIDDYQWFEVKGESIRDESGTAIRSTGSIKNCTYEKEILQSVLESEEAKNMALDASHIGVWTGNLLDSTWTWDSRVDEIFEFSESEKGDLDAWAQRLHPEDKGRALAALERSLNEAQPFEEEYRIITPNKQIKYIAAKGKVSPNVFGDLVRIDGICFDNTDAILARQKIEEINQDLEERVKQRTKELEESRDLAEAGSHSKSNFLAMMSHEIRTPMNGVIGALDLVEIEAMDIAQQELISTAKQSALNLVAILNDILDLNKIEAGKLTIEAIDISVAKVIDDVISTFNCIAESRKINLSVIEKLDYQDNVCSDPVRIRQILSNLISNALKFTDKADGTGQVTLTVQKNPELSLGPLEYIEFIVEDNGIGMKPSTVERLFTPFTQAEDSTTRKYGGTGLGLTVCANLSELLGGTIAVTSEYGIGSKFTFGLSLWPAKSLTVLPELFGEDILIVEPFLPPYQWVTELYDQSGAFVTETKLSDFTCPEKLAYQLEVATYVLVNAINQPVAALKPILENIPEQHKSKLYIWVENHARPELYQYVSASSQLNSPPITSHKIKYLAQMKSTPRINQELAAVDLTHGGKEASILVVEDNPLNQKLLLRQIEKLGYQADIASNGLQGLDLYRQHHYPIILTDCHMPEMDGYNMTESIRTHEQSSNISPSKILALTGAAMTGDKEKCLSCGMDDFLTKPIQIHELQNALEKWHA